MQQPSKIGENQQQLDPINNNNCRKITLKVLQILSLIAFTVGLALIVFNPGILSLLGIIGSLDVIVISSCIGVSFLVTVISFLMFLVVTIVDCSKKETASSITERNDKKPDLNEGVFGINRERMNCGFCSLLQLIFNDPDIIKNVKEKSEDKDIKNVNEKEIYKWLVDNLKIYKQGKSVDSQKFRELVANVSSISSKSSEEIDVAEAMAAFDEIFPKTLLELKIFGKDYKTLKDNTKDEEAFPLSIPLNENEVIFCLKDFMNEKSKEVLFNEGKLEERIENREIRLERNPNYLNLHLNRFKHISKFETITNVKGHNRRVFIDGVEYVRAVKSRSITKEESGEEKEDIIYENYFISEYEEYRRKWFSKESEELLKKYFPELYEYPKRYEIKDINGEERLFLNDKEIEKEIKVKSKGERVKISKDIKVNLELKIKKTDHSLEKNDTYDLKFFIVHNGATIDSGHYIAYVKVGKNWYECNDNRVSKKDLSYIETAAKQVYFLRYKKR